MAGYGGTQLLPRIVGPGRAKYMILTGAILTAREAFEFGLVDKVSPPESLIEEVTGLAQKIAASGPLSIKGSKEAIDRALRCPWKRGSGSNWRYTTKWQTQRMRRTVCPHSWKKESLCLEASD